MPLATLLRLVSPAVIESLQLQSLAASYVRRSLPLQSRLVVEELSANRGEFDARGVSLEIDSESGSMRLLSSPQEMDASYAFVMEFIAKAKQRLLRRVRPFPLNGSAAASGGYVILVGAGGIATDVLTPSDSVRVLLTLPAPGAHAGSPTHAGATGPATAEFNSSAGLDEAIVTELLRAGVSGDLAQHALPSETRLVDPRRAYADFASVSAAAAAVQVLNQIPTSVTGPPGTSARSPLAGVVALAVAVDGPSVQRRGVKVRPPGYRYCHVS